MAKGLISTLKSEYFQLMVLAFLGGIFYFVGIISLAPFLDQGIDLGNPEFWASISVLVLGLVSITLAIVQLVKDE